MYEGKFEDDIVVGVFVALRGGLVGEVTNIDYKISSYEVKVPGLMPINYAWGSFKGPSIEYDIMHLVSNHVELGVQQAAKDRYGRYIDKPTTEEYQYAVSEDYNHDIPDWACDLVPEGLIVVGQQLLTKDGRVTGNATIFNIAYDIELGDPKFYCITDAGNIIKLTSQELNNQFYLGKYIMNDYPGDPDGSKLEYTEY